MKKAAKSRELALEILTEWEEKGRKADELIREVLDKYFTPEWRERAFLKRLAEGCIERQITLDYVIAKYAVVKKGKLKPMLRRILRMGIYQLLYMDSVPDNAACNEAVLLAEAKGYGVLKGFVNGVLRNVARKRDEIPFPEKKDWIPYLSVSYSVPEWICKKYTAWFGGEIAERMLSAGMEERPLTLRLTGRLLSKGNAAVQELLRKWQESGMEFTESPYLPAVYQCRGTGDVRELSGFREGYFQIQDISSQIAVYAAGIQKGDTVVDVCAAPGSKSMLAAELTGSEGRVYAFDISENKVERIRENCERLGFSQVLPAVWDAREAKEELKGKADVVLADLPCSGLGVMGRKPDIRYRLKEEELAELAMLQRRILEQAIAYLKPGGRLCYSTCTVNPSENEENRSFLLADGRLETVGIRERIPEALYGEDSDEGFLRIRSGYPEGLPVLDGFFISCFRRKID